MSKLVNI